MDEKPGYEEGIVVLTNDPLDDSDNVKYIYRFYQGVYQVWNDEEEEWVTQPPGWVPGNEPKLP